MIRNLLINAENSDNTAVIEERRRYTYRDLQRKAAAVQSRLAEIKGQNAAILLPNCADYISALFGTFSAGVTAFPLNVQLTAHELAPLLSKAGVRTVITSARYSHLLRGGERSVEIILIESFSGSGETVLRAAPGRDEPMILLSTSGTTGNAKLVQLSERNAETAVRGFAEYNCYEIFGDLEIKYILGTPFPTVYGLLILSTCLMMGFPIFIPEETVSPDILYKAAQEHKITHYEGGAAIPVLMDQMSDRLIPYDISSLRFIGYGGSKVAADVLIRLAAAFPGIHVCTGYGSTESAALITRPYKALPPDKLDSVGIAIPGVTVMVDADGVITDTPRRVGEIVVKGPNVMLGYFENEEETLKIIRDGFLYTGDIGYLDEERYLYLCGRSKNVIKVRGFSVYAEEVEACLMNSGFVRDCLVYGQSDEFDNEILCADIIPAGAQAPFDEIRRHCGEFLADYKRPQRLRAVEAIKKTPTGKSERGNKSGE